MAGVFGTNATRAQLLGDPAVVEGELLKRSTTQQIRATVPNVSDQHATTIHHSDDQSGPRLATDQISHPRNCGIGVVHGRFDGLRWRTALAEASNRRLNSGFRGLTAPVMATHAVSDDQACVPRIRRVAIAHKSCPHVLVLGANSAAIGDASNFHTAGAVSDEPRNRFSGHGDAKTSSLA
jgi:hypothetical protein